MVMWIKETPATSERAKTLAEELAASREEGHTSLVRAKKNIDRKLSKLRARTKGGPVRIIAD